MARSKMYFPIMEKIFVDRYQKGRTELPFVRKDIEDAAADLGIGLPKNLGDVVYSSRYRAGFSEKILETQPNGKEWVINGAGRSKYVFRLVSINRIIPNENLLPIKVPDATPEIVQLYALTDEQALLAKVRYNRLIDIFLSCAAYSLQNHLRTTVKGVGQIEVDEMYVGINKHGVQYIVPVQAKGGTDQLGGVQASQDIQLCAEKYPALVCRPVAAQFIEDSLIAMFELAMDGDELRLVHEQHYRLVPGADIDASDLARYRTTAGE